MGLSGWVVWSPFIFYLPLFLTTILCCPAHIDISKLKWILLFSADQCAALGILSERTRSSLCCKGVLLGASLCGTFLL